ncbi:MAG: hypothetical protein EB117_15715 [Betaproteobacteria bacterium]|jgi:hypothetical protein|nr:hypothetical protein [Betaproteobacteria bacterium]
MQAEEICTDVMKLIEDKFNELDQDVDLETLQEAYSLIATGMLFTICQNLIHDGQKPSFDKWWSSVNTAIKKISSQPTCQHTRH